MAVHTMDSRARSIAVIQAGQNPAGGYIASPTFATYAYSWVRDGSFIAYAMDRVGEHGSSGAFHRWVADTLLRHRHRKYLHCRYTLDGQEAVADWPNYQLDGYGAWLWSLDQHVVLSGTTLTDEIKEAATFAANYIGGLWDHACSDCWEEHPDQVHVSTLACLYGGLQASAGLLDRPNDRCVAQSIREVVLRAGVNNGRLAKWLGGNGIDASLLWGSTPFGLLDAHDLRMQATLADIERRCMDSTGGVHRYPEDTYYGGGAWLLLTAWLGWHYARLGRQADALRCLGWVEARADAVGMPEQVADRLNDVAGLSEWIARWGPSAHPLLWSHAMHLVLLEEVRAWRGR